jgi:hypothetical protein
MDHITALSKSLSPKELLDHLGSWSIDPERDNPLSHMESVGTLRRVADAIGVEELAWIIGSSSVCLRTIVNSSYVPDDLDPRMLLNLSRKAFGRKIGALRKMTHS